MEEGMNITSCNYVFLPDGWELHGFKFLQADFIQKASLKRKNNCPYYTPALVC